MSAPLNVDIVVIGGGSAGLCAAVAAARRGARVVLLEKSDRLGGMGTLAMVHTFCGLYDPDVSFPPRIANPGLPAEIERLSRERSGAEPILMGKVYVLPQHPEDFVSIASELTSAEKSLDVWLGAVCFKVEQRSDQSFTVHTRDRKLLCRAMIDTSADAILADFLSATRISVPPDQSQRSAFIFSLSNLETTAFEEIFKMRLALEIVRAVKLGKLPPAAMGTACRSSTKAGELFFTTDLDPAPSHELLATGQKLAESLNSFLREKFSEFAAAKGPVFASRPGIRESYRWQGRYTLTADDLVNGNEFPDTIAYATWPIELRETTRGPRLTYFNKPVPSHIPLRSLLSSEHEGVFFAGRCLSATHEALASVRVMGTCFATGQAAGIAATDYLRS